MNTSLINTPRLALRPYRTGDLEDFVALNADAQVRCFVGGVLTPAESVSRFQTFSETRDFVRAITVRGTDRYIGHCWLVIRDEPEMGLLLVSDVWRRGYGTEVAVALLEYALTHRGHSRVTATVDADHLASIGLLERAGMKREREQHDEKGVYFVYAKTEPSGITVIGKPDGW